MTPAAIRKLRQRLKGVQQLLAPAKNLRWSKAVRHGFVVDAAAELARVVEDLVSAELDEWDNDDQHSMVVPVVQWLPCVAKGGRCPGRARRPRRGEWCDDGLPADRRPCRWAWWFCDTCGSSYASAALRLDQVLQKARAA